MPMQVLVLGPHPTRGPGLARLGRLVEHGWRAAGAQVKVLTAPAPLSRHVPWQHAGRGVAVLERAAWSGSRLTRQAQGARVDLVHVIDPRDALCTTSLPGDLPVTVTVNDPHVLLAALGRSHRRVSAVERVRAQMIVKALQKADHVLCTSSAAAHAVHELTRHAPTVLHPPVDPALASRMTAAGPHRPPEWPYLLTVADSGDRDRRAETIRAWSHLRRSRALDGASLLVVGDPLTAAEEGAAAACGGHVEAVSGIGDDHLAALYQGAEAVLALGRAAGFCWSVAEAHAAGRPVLAADEPHLQEIGADGCLYLPVDRLPEFDPPTWHTVAEDLASTVLAGRARANGTRFGWDAFVRGLPGAVMPAAAGPPRRPVSMVTIPAQSDPPSVELPPDEPLELPVTWTGPADQRT